MILPSAEFPTLGLTNNPKPKASMSCGNLFQRYKRTKECERTVSNSVLPDRLLGKTRPRKKRLLLGTHPPTFGLKSNTWHPI